MKYREVAFLADHIDVLAQAVRCRASRKPWASRSLAVKVVDYRFGLVYLDRGDGGRQGMGLRAVGGGKQEDAFLVVMDSAQVHQLSFAGECRKGEAVGDGFAEGREIRHDVVVFLGAAKCQRNPVIFSSRMNTAPLRWHSSIVLCRKPSAAPRRGPAPGSRRRSGRGARRRAVGRSRCRCSERSGRVREAWGMPAFIGVLPMNQSSYEKKGWSPQKATRSRPV